MAFALATLPTHASALARSEQYFFYMPLSEAFTPSVSIFQVLIFRFCSRFPSSRSQVVFWFKPARPRRTPCRTVNLGSSAVRRVRPRRTGERCALSAAPAQAARSQSAARPRRTVERCVDGGPGARRAARSSAARSARRRRTVKR